MAFVSDSFTDTDGTTLGDHTGETGATWTSHPAGAYSVHAKIDANRVHSNSALRCYYASGTPASADYDVEAVVRRVTASGNIGIVGRLDTSANTMYLAMWTAGGQWQLYKIVAGTSTQLGSSYNDNPANGTDRTVKLQMRGTAIKVFIDGVERISVTDSAVTAAGRAGLRGTTGTSTTGFHVDSLTATDASTTVSRSASIDAATGIASAGARVPATSRSAALTASTGINASGAPLAATSRSAAISAGTGINVSGASLPVTSRSAALTAASEITTTRSLTRLRSASLAAATQIATVGTQTGVTSRAATLTAATLIATDSGLVRLRSAGLAGLTEIASTATATRYRSASLSATSAIASAWSPLARPAELVVSLSPDALMALGTTSLTTTLDTEATEVELQTA